MKNKIYEAAFSAVTNAFIAFFQIMILVTKISKIPYEIFFCLVIVYFVYQAAKNYARLQVLKSKKDE